MTNSNLIQAGIDKSANGSKPENGFFDTKIQFESWMDEVKPVSPLQIDQPAADFIVECDSLSNCEIQFEGVLQLSGFLDGNIRSPGGTLITGPGIINANIEVATAIIGTFGNVNILATERVLLRGNVSVAGNIRAHSLSIREGAVFDGDCSLQESQERAPVAPHLQTGEASQVTLAASSAGD